MSENLVADAAPVLIWVAGTDPLCTYLNQQWLKYTGRTMEQELGTGWLAGVHAEDAPHFLEVYHAASRERRSFTMEFRLRRADGQYRWVAGTAVPRLTLDKELSGYIGACFDIQERKLSEQLRQILMTHLLKLQDEEGKRIATDLHSKVSQSLAIIKNRAMIAMKEKASAESVLEQLKEISAAATAAISDVRKISHNLRPYELDRLGLAAAIESLVQHISRSTPISLSTHLDQFEGMLSTEVETSIYRIVQEGIHNVIKHSNATSARIEIRKKGHQLTVLIQDNGIGIPAGQSAADGNKTVGLGLAGIAERVRGFGGSFEIESESQCGTKLMIRLETDRVATE